MRETARGARIPARILAAHQLAGFGRFFHRQAEIQHHAPFDLAGLEVGEDLVDVAERRGLDLGPYLARDGKGDGLIEVAARSDDRPPAR
jgi:hypothetical protein